MTTYKFQGFNVQGLDITVVTSDKKQIKNLQIAYTSPQCYFLLFQVK
jgi:hypothetical protein